MTPHLYYNRLGRPILEDADGILWRLRAEGESLVFVSALGERLHAPVPSAWELLSAEELEGHRRSARAVDPGEHATG